MMVSLGIAVLFGCKFGLKNLHKNDLISDVANLRTR